jgi:hypothetical protein
MCACRFGGGWKGQCKVHSRGDIHEFFMVAFWPRDASRTAPLSFTGLAGGKHERNDFSRIPRQLFTALNFHLRSFAKKKKKQNKTKQNKTKQNQKYSAHLFLVAPVFPELYKPSHSNSLPIRQALIKNDH